MENKNKVNKVLLFLPTLLGGGAEETFTHLAKYLASKNLKVYLVVGTNKSSNLYSFDENENISLIELNARRLIFSFFKLYSTVKKVQPNTLLSTLWYANILIYPISKLLKIPLIVREAGSDYREDNTIKSGIISKIIKYVYSRSNFTISISESLKDDLVQNVGIPNDKIFTIYNPVESYIKREELSKIDFKDYFQDSSKNTRFIITACRLDKIKGLEYLIKSFTFLRDIDIKLLIIGDGKERENLERMVDTLDLKDSITLLNWQNNIYDFIYSCDFYISTSINEGLGNAYLASQLLNKKSLCSNIPASLEINSIFNKGDSFDIKDIDIAKKIRSIYQENKANSEIDDNIINKFIFETCFKSYLNLINKSIGS